MSTSTTENVTLNLSGRWRGTYALRNDPDMLSALAPAILTHLGCSYEIRWPDRTEEDRERRIQDRKARSLRLRAKAEQYALERTAHLVLDPEVREVVFDLVQQSYMAGHNAAPKPVNR